MHEDASKTHHRPYAFVAPLLGNLPLRSSNVSVRPSVGIARKGSRIKLRVGHPSAGAIRMKASGEIDKGEVPELREEDEETFVMEEDVEGEEASDRHTPHSFQGSLVRLTAGWFHESRITDVALVGTIIAVVYGLVATCSRVFSSTPYSSLAIATSLSVLPWYAAQSLTRMLAGYLVSLLFSLSYAYIAHRVSFVAQILMLLIDVLQSIPLLSFLPGVVLGLIAIFPGARIGVEFAAVLLLFTSMAWNMLLGFYQSLCGVSQDLNDVARTFRLSPWKRFWVLELPAGAIGLIWNSIISVAGGWFFLISIESFELGNKDFRLPGLGSFLAAAAEAGDYTAILWGLAVVIAIIVIIDFLIWRPLIAWSSKFSEGGSRSADPSLVPKSAVLNFLQRSSFVRTLKDEVFGPLWEKFVNMELPSMRRTPESEYTTALETSFSSIVQSGEADGPPASPVVAILSWVIRGAFAAVLVFMTWKAIGITKALSASTWMSLGKASVYTFCRVFAALMLSLLWTVPAGVAIGRDARLAAKIQPIIQIAASVPATALFPFVLLFLAKLGGGLQIGSVALMMLGTMWYILFNVVAGTQAIPAEYFDVDAVYNRQSRWKRWKRLILPGIFPYLLTGVVTAVGGAWNASIVSEYVVFRGGVMKTPGLGAIIQEAAASGNYPLLLAGTLVMSVLVLLTNRFVWGPLYRMAETKYKI